MLVPQFEIQPLSPGAEVPGEPVGDFEMVQKSLLIPHWPCLFYMRKELAVAKCTNWVVCIDGVRVAHTQQALRGQGFRLARAIPAGGCTDPGF